MPLNLGSTTTTTKIRKSKRDKIMGNKKCNENPKVILVPYPAQGHVTPMIKLASAFINHGLEAVIITPEFIHRRIISTNMDPNGSNNISCMSLPDGMETDKPIDFFAIEKAMEDIMPKYLEVIVKKAEEESYGGGVVCLVVDLLASWAIDVGHRCGVPVAGFWPAMLATYHLIAAIPDFIRTGIISDCGSPQHVGPVSFLPNQPLLSNEDLPWLIGTPAARKARFRFWTRTLDRSRNLPWLLVNSFPTECNSIDDKPQEYALLDNSIGSQQLIFTVGALSKHAIVKNPSCWQEDMSCLEWLDKKNPESVMYISFGSWVNPIGEEKVRALALALESIGQAFIWVLGPNWRDGLPVGYLQRVSKLGKVVSWAPQLEVLQHKAVGCFLTHCGWNSTMEAIEHQKRLLCYPVAGDQFVNCAYIVEKWRIGVKINGFLRKDVEEGLRKLMEDNRMKTRLIRLQEIIMGEEASSVARSNVTAFIDGLIINQADDQSLSEFVW